MPWAISCWDFDAKSPDEMAPRLLTSAAVGTRRIHELHPSRSIRRHVGEEKPTDCLEVEG